VTSHFALMAVFALLVSAVFAALLRDDPRQQLRTGAYMFGIFLAVALAFGWLMYPLPL
jgi:heme A synthase